MEYFLILQELVSCSSLYVHVFTCIFVVIKFKRFSRYSPENVVDVYMSLKYVQICFKHTHLETHVFICERLCVTIHSSVLQ